MRVSKASDSLLLLENITDYAFAVICAEAVNGLSVPHGINTMKIKLSSNQR